MTVKHDCSGKIRGAYRDVSGRVYKCARHATVERDGKWYCWQHDPEWMKADKEKRWAADREKMDRKAAMWKRRARNASLAELVTPELAEWLERLASYTAAHTDSFARPHSSWALRRRAEVEGARELAARIRETLGETE